MSYVNPVNLSNMSYKIGITPQKINHEVQYPLNPTLKDEIAREKKYFMTKL